jgi:hypothetical protein
MADAEAICKAVTRANMRFVPTKTPEQQSGDLHAVPGADEERRGGRPRGRPLVERAYRHDAQARTARTVRSPGHRSLLAARLERCHRLRPVRIRAPEPEPVAAPRRYSLGTLFHVWEGLRFQNAVWHGFVLLGAACHYSAVLACLV